MRVPITEIITVASIIGLIVYDVFAMKIGQPTESMVLRDWGRDWTLLPFVAGFLLGHWFGPRQVVTSSAWMYALPILGVLLAVDIFWNIKFHGVYPFWRYSLFYALAGIPAGMYLWGQPGGWSPLP